MGTYDGINETDSNLDGSALRIGVVMSRFNRDICDGLLAACTGKLGKRGVKPANMRIVTVPGALEIPLILRKMAVSGKFDALIAIGAVVRGDTYHFEVVSNEMASGITRVQLDTGVPIANAVLTTDTDEQAHCRTSAKGAEAADCAIEMANLLKVL
ncbi:MAG: 6,7-dimethyl-8-ribityllumazine synthase [Sulfuriferula sp.]|jgi:6,7-dimethyl-8-ribityllumazine synthase|nr:6,7-dimethyl-8-ribityllumazine synthase [Sulfuriferula sp.]